MELPPFLTGLGTLLPTGRKKQLKKGTAGERENKKPGLQAAQSGGGCERHGLLSHFLQRGKLGGVVQSWTSYHVGGRGGRIKEFAGGEGAFKRGHPG